MTLATPHSNTPSAADLDAARLLLARLGVSPADLLTVAADRAPAPTFDEYVPRAAVTSGTRRVYGSYWNKITEHWGADAPTNRPQPRSTNSPSASRPMSLPAATHAADAAPQSHLIAALRCLYRHAEDDGLITSGDNPARKVAKPRRLPSTRRAVPDTRLAEINHIAATTGNDPALDALLLRLHTETACRRGGALALRPVDLDPDQCLIRLHEKGETVRWQPASRTLMAYLNQHAALRGAPTSGQLLRYACGRSGNSPGLRSRYSAGGGSW
jgi:hypothetical protein